VPITQQPVILSSIGQMSKFAMYDPTFELTYREYGSHPELDEYAELLSIGCSPEEAAAILDANLLSCDEWTEMYGNEEEVDPGTDYSILVVI
jgi:hypothetical protein